MDLIYEGITTMLAQIYAGLEIRQNGPDLRRDYDLASPTLYTHQSFVRMDLIYEGITTKFVEPLTSFAI